MVYEFATSEHRDHRTGLAAANALEFERLDAALLHDLISVGRQIQKDGLGDVGALVRRNPLLVQVRTAIALGIFDKRCMNGISDEYFNCSIQHFWSPKVRKDSTAFWSMLLRLRKGEQTQFSHRGCWSGSKIPARHLCAQSG